MTGERAISPIIATIFLIAITITGAMVAKISVVEIMRAMPKTMAQGMLNFDCFNVVGTDCSNITVYLRNVGGRPLTLNAVYVDGRLYEHRGLEALPVDNSISLYARVGFDYREYVSLGGSVNLNGTKFKWHDVP